MDARLREGISLFNDGRFFESHEVLEAFYQETDPCENYQPAFLQVRVKQLCKAMEVWVEKADGAEAAPHSSTIPKIQLQRFSFFS